MAVEVFMPKMSDHMAVGIIVSWLVKEGDHIEKGQPILEVETDKATVELEASATGFIKGIRSGTSEGAQVPVGDTIAFIVSEKDEPITKLPSLSQSVQEEDAVRSDIPSKLSSGGSKRTGPARAAPAVRRLARELHIDIDELQGSGPGGRVLEADVISFARRNKTAQDAIPTDSRTVAPITPVAQRLAARLGVDLGSVRPSGPGGRITKEDIQALADIPPGASPVAVESHTPADESVDWIDLTKAQLSTGQRMVESVTTAPQFALSIFADAANMLDMRARVRKAIEAQSGATLSVTAILVRMVASALKRYPRANASFVDGRIQLHREINLGVAVGTEQGLVVPVIRNADQKSLAEITKEMDLLQEKASKLRFSPNDLTGGTFTISNLGMFGINSFQAIVNPPETAILAVGSITKTPVAFPDDAIGLRPTMSLTLSVDHRSLDGMQAARFLSILKEFLEDPYLLL